MNSRRTVPGFGDALARALRLPSESVYSKALTLIAGLSLLLGTAVVLLASQIILREFTETERREMAGTLQRLMLVLQRENLPLEGALGDWIASHPAGADSQLPPPRALDAFDVDFLSIARHDRIEGTIVRPTGATKSDTEGLDWTRWTRDPSRPMNRAAATGFILVGNRLAAFSWRSVGQDEKLAVGRFFGERQRSGLEELFGARIAFLPSLGLTLDAESGVLPATVLAGQDAFVEARGPDTLVGRVLVRAINGVSIGQMELTQNRPLYQQGLQAVQIFLTAITLAGGALLAIVWLLLDRTILTRIRDLTRKVELEKTNDRLPLRLDFDGADELATLARRIETLAAELDSAQSRYRSVVEDQTEVICRFSPSLVITFANRVFERLVRRGQATGLALREILPAATYETLATRFGALTPEREVETFLMQITGPDAEPIWFRNTLRATFSTEGAVVSGQWVAADITPQVLAQQRLQESERELRSLSSRLLRLQDDERRRIARELHDSTAQSLSALEMNMSLLEPAMGDVAMQRIVAETRQIARDCCLELRNISYLLHPPLLDEVGLPFAIEWFADGFQKRSTIRVTLALDPAFPRLEPEVETTLFRILQEAMTNIYRHSEADRAWVTLAFRDGLITLEIRDNGKGLSKEESPPGGVGFAGMRERLAQLGGKLEVHSSPYGVRISVTLDYHPLHAYGNGQDSDR